ncbi:hypothetical protein PAHAL_8G044300 [Panicum hallii]|uniref:Uncharacterized protein n=1 Tax=Panicum hallii TaxID=206008 RepID=A0A2S3ICP9_9POAL|nr:hypothetical protein PAHAL_8G044300 [Panicum hallii]
MQRRDEAVRPQNPPKKSNRNHSACERKKSPRIRRKEPDFKAMGTRSHPSIIKSPRNPISETECRPEPQQKSPRGRNRRTSLAPTTKNQKQKKTFKIQENEGKENRNGAH